MEVSESPLSSKKSSLASIAANDQDDSRLDSEQEDDLKGTCSQGFEVQEGDYEKVPYASFIKSVLKEELCSENNFDDDKLKSDFMSEQESSLICDSDTKQVPYSSILQNSVSSNELSNDKIMAEDTGESETGILDKNKSSLICGSDTNLQTEIGNKSSSIAQSESSHVLNSSGDSDMSVDQEKSCSSSKIDSMSSSFDLDNSTKDQVDSSDDNQQLKKHIATTTLSENCACEAVSQCSMDIDQLAPDLVSGNRDPLVSPDSSKSHHHSSVSSVLENSATSGEIGSSSNETQEQGETITSVCDNLQQSDGIDKKKLQFTSGENNLSFSGEAEAKVLPSATCVTEEGELPPAVQCSSSPSSTKNNVSVVESEKEEGEITDDEEEEEEVVASSSLIDNNSSLIRDTDDFMNNVSSENSVQGEIAEVESSVSNSLIETTVDSVLESNSQNEVVSSSRSTSPNSKFSRYKQSQWHPFSTEFSSKNHNSSPTSSPHLKEKLDNVEDHFVDSTSGSDSYFKTSGKQNPDHHSQIVSSSEWSKSQRDRSISLDSIEGFSPASATDSNIASPTSAAVSKKEKKKVQYKFSLLKRPVFFVCTVF